MAGLDLVMRLRLKTIGRHHSKHARHVTLLEATRPAEVIADVLSPLSLSHLAALTSPELLSAQRALCTCSYLPVCLPACLPTYLVQIFMMARPLATTKAASSGIPTHLTPGHAHAMPPAQCQCHYVGPHLRASPNTPLLSLGLE